MRRDYQIPIIMICFTVLGLACDLMVYAMYQAGVIVDELLLGTTITIPDLMTVILAVWLFVGLIVAATR